MAAKFERTLSRDLDKEHIAQHISDIVSIAEKKYPWHVVAKTEDKIILKSEAGRLSWGEIITIHFDRNHICVRSECSFPLQFIDYGKNRQNVNSIMTLLMSATSPDNKKTAVDKGSFLTWTVCAICVAIFAGISQTDSGFRSTLLHMTSARFYSGSYWGLVTSVFTHLQLWHLLFNVYWLWILGGALERAIGRGNWIIFFLLSAMISSGTQLGVSGGTGIGASGVVYAMFGFVWFGREHYFNFRKIATKPTIILFLGWLIFCIIGTWLNIMRVANAAHIAGLLFGAGVAFLMLKSKKQTSISQSKTTSG